MSNWDEMKETFKKTLEKVIELKYITKADFISLDGLAAMFANDLSHLEMENRKREETDRMFTAMQKYYPKMFEEVIKATHN